jgi:hypothetical protein
MSKFVTLSLRRRLLKFDAALKQRNLIDEIVKRHVDLTNYTFGLHAWIRVFECLLHISYRLEIKNGMHEREKINESYKIRTENYSAPLQKLNGSFSG